MNTGEFGWRSSAWQKLVVIILVTALFIALELVVHYGFGIDIIYTHFFYPLLILAAFWYQRRAVYLGVFLAGAHITVEYLQNAAIEPGVLVRAMMFIAVAYILGYLFELLERRYADYHSYLTGYTDRGADSGRHLETGEEGAGAAVHPRDLQRLIGNLQSKNPDVRYKAAEALGALKNPRAVEPLAALLADEESGVRWKAAEALGQMGRAAVEPLTESLSDPNVDVRWMAAVALGDIGDPRAIDPLLKALEDEDTYVRSRAAMALGRIGEPARDALIAALRSEKENVRWGAALALGSIGGESTIEALIRTLDDASPHVRHRVIGALDEIGSPAIPYLIRGFNACTPTSCQSIAEAFGGIGRPAVEPLTRALRDGRWEVRAGAAASLGEIGDPTGVDALIESLDDERPEVAAAARNALKQMKKL
ncbi:hypothetical protein ABH15_05370 [Methanoculleus taiwanensis]|uniref:PBS lyase n=1 Tax=Methanoculleus taiwanensis TaxID=1550565 RepID=A0A498GYN7_9EURY|nr:HEAT repeat domain-containing protein [Methanoculleus taiwanensis]RXE55672.1 hypothetical protein ABH15_05370 [Methanoculleus taiwanensis]